MKRVTDISSVLLFLLAAQANASTISLSASGQWTEFAIDSWSAKTGGVEWIDLNDSNSPDFGSASIYHFTIDSGFRGLLNIVDGGFAGDRFQIFNNGQALALTSDTTNSSDYSNDFSLNLDNPNFSQGLFTLSPGTYNLTGELFSTLQPFTATNGALKLDVTAVPVPNSFGLLLCGVSLMAYLQRRRVCQRGKSA